MRLPRSPTLDISVDLCCWNPQLGVRAWGCHWLASSSATASSRSHVPHSSWPKPTASLTLLLFESSLEGIQELLAPSATTQELTEDGECTWRLSPHDLTILHPYVVVNPFQIGMRLLHVAFSTQNPNQKVGQNLPLLVAFPLAKTKPSALHTLLYLFNFSHQFLPFL